MGEERVIERSKVTSAGQRFESEIATRFTQAKDAIEREDIGTSNFTTVAWRLAAAYSVTHGFMTRQLEGSEETATEMTERVDLAVSNWKKSDEDATFPEVDS